MFSKFGLVEGKEGLVRGIVSIFLKTVQTGLS